MQIRVTMPISYMPPDGHVTVTECQTTASPTPPSVEGEAVDQMQSE